MQSSSHTTRKSLPLSRRDLEALETVRRSTPHRDALARLAGTDLTDEPSEAQLLRAVVEAGLRAVRLEVEETGYAAIATDLDQATARQVARRRPPSWGAE